MPPHPPECDGTLDTGSELVTAAASRKERLVDPLDIDAAIQQGCYVVGDLD